MVWGKKPEKPLFGFKFDDNGENKKMSDVFENIYKKISDNFEMGYLLAVPILFLYFFVFGLIWHAGTTLLMFAGVIYLIVAMF